MSITVQEICKKLFSAIKDSNIVGIAIFDDEDRNNFYNYLERIGKQIKTPENREKNHSLNDSNIIDNIKKNITENLQRNPLCNHQLLSGVKLLVSMYALTGCLGAWMADPLSSIGYQSSVCQTLCMKYIGWPGILLEGPR